MRLWGVVKIAVGVIACSWLCVFLARYQGRFQNWVINPVPRYNSKPLPLGGEIATRRERLLSDKVLREHARVKRLLDAARARGADVSRLEPMLGPALSLAQRNQFDRALILLNRIEMDIPRERDKVMPARVDEDPLPQEPEMKTRTLGRQAAPAPKRRRGR